MTHPVEPGSLRYSIAMISLTVALSAAGISAPATEAKTHPSCGSAKHPTLAANSVARLFRAYNPRGDVRETIGCLDGSRRRVVLGFREAMQEYTFTHPRLAGPLRGWIPAIRGSWGRVCQDQGVRLAVRSASLRGGLGSVVGS